jgi:DNA-3-methyladenine glycosylase
MFYCDRPPIRKFDAVTSILLYAVGGGGRSAVVGALADPQPAPSGPCGGPIVEVEAYLTDDPASHAFGGETTAQSLHVRAAGPRYVYLIYGFHFCVNAVCRPAGRAEAVLIRAIEAQVGIGNDAPKPAGGHDFALTNGPGKLCEALAIDRKLDGVDLCDASSPLFIARNPNLARFRRQRGPVAVSARIGITKAAGLPLRFYLGGSPFISRRCAQARRHPANDASVQSQARPKC